MIVKNEEWNIIGIRNIILLKYIEVRERERERERERKRDFYDVRAFYFILFLFSLSLSLSLSLSIFWFLQFDDCMIILTTQQKGKDRKSGRLFLFRILDSSLFHYGKTQFFWKWFYDIIPNYRFTCDSFLSLCASFFLFFVSFSFPPIFLPFSLRWLLCCSWKNQARLE